jgi:hypothetical protein
MSPTSSWPGGASTAPPPIHVADSAGMTLLRIVIPLYLYDLRMISA